MRMLERLDPFRETAAVSCTIGEKIWQDRSGR
jgi:hypothetical protein